MLGERNLSIRAVARIVDVDPTHLSRVLRGARGERAGAKLARQLAEALELPKDYFPEFREACLIERIQEDPVLRDRLYDQVV